MEKLSFTKSASPSAHVFFTASKELDCPSVGVDAGQPAGGDGRAVVGREAAQRLLPAEKIRLGVAVAVALLEVVAQARCLLVQARVALLLGQLLVAGLLLVVLVRFAFELAGQLVRGAPPLLLVGRRRFVAVALVVVVLLVVVQRHRLEAVVVVVLQRVQLVVVRQVAHGHGAELAARLGRLPRRGDGRRHVGRRRLLPPPLQTRLQLVQFLSLHAVELLLCVLEEKKTQMELDLVVNK